MCSAYTHIAFGGLPPCCYLFMCGCHVILDSWHLELMACHSVHCLVLFAHIYTKIYKHTAAVDQADQYLRENAVAAGQADQDLRKYTIAEDQADQDLRENKVAVDQADHDL